MYETAKATLKNLNLYLAKYAEFFQTNTNYKIAMSFGQKWETLASYIYLFDLDLS